MSAQQFSFDWTQKLPPLVQERIAEGMAQSDENANHFWKRMIDAAIVAVARRMKEFTVDDVLDEMEKIPHCPETHALHALGPAMSRARHDKIVTPTNRLVRSSRPVKHGNRRSVWISNYYAEAR
jgi:hypothetical protein